MLSRHLELEIAAVFSSGPLAPGAPVPGCGCARCQVMALGGSEADGDEAEDMVVVLARMPEDERIPAARAWAEERERCGRQVVVPSPGVLAILAAREPDALRSLLPMRSNLSRLVDDARALPILDVVRRFVGEPRKQGRSWVVRCPFHDDRRPSLTISAGPGLWKCWVCDVGGDGISLVMRLRGLEFVDAIKEMVT